MEEKFEEYRKDFLNDIRLNAQIDSIMPDEYFLDNMLDRLVTMGEIVDPIVKPIRKKCSNNRIMSFDAYSFDASDKSIVLITNNFSDSTTDEKITKSDIEVLKTRMLNFLEESYNDNLNKFFDITDDIVLIGKNIGKRMKKDYLDVNNDAIDKIKLYIVTNKLLSEKITSLNSEDFFGKKVEINIWGIKRLYELYMSGRDREAIYIEIKKYGVEGIPFIKAEMVNNIDYDAYLAIVPGKFLNDIYYDHGSRLLEGNVRVFLSTRGKINKGIRNTIHKEPTKFFAYNNGICCTASKIELSNDGRMITGIEDLQIINGGQTTASLSSAVLKDKMSLANIFVPMKLTVVKNDQYDEMIQNISKFANSQNKVKDSDLFSNHPFHRKFEELSKKYISPIRKGAVNATYWYYERSRGKYENEQFKFTKKSDKDKFSKMYPKKQVIKKEELAKYYIAAELLRPDVVSRGAEKSMSFFAEYLEKKIDANENYVKSSINENFYKKCIAYAILFRKVDEMVAKAGWYSTGGNKYNIVPYTISKFITMIPNDYLLDYEKIWKSQDLSPELMFELEKIAIETNKFISDSNGIIVGEYCKKEETWKKFKEKKLILGKINDDLISKEYIESKEKAEIKNEKKLSKMDIVSSIYSYPSSYWLRLLEAAQKRKEYFSDQEIRDLQTACNLKNSRYSIKEYTFVSIWKVREKLEKLGVLVD